jgi:multisubunit Na+/H+ antiporter MnhB subunit
MSRRDAFAVVFFAIVAVFLIVGALRIHPFGPAQGQDGFDAPMDDYIIDNAQEETGASNTVTSVVFDYRGFDTLGEATVLFTAVAGVILVFRRLKK